jgi:putative chitinase
MKAFDQFLERVLADKDITDPRQRAYVLATVRHETGNRWLPVDEIGKGKGRAYGFPVEGQLYYGRGFVQLTWYTNYEKVGKLLNLDLTGNPDLASDYDTAYLILSLGMSRGLFTGKKLAHYINADGCDYVNARRIVNGTDRAELIAKYARDYEHMLIGGPTLPEAA